VDAELDLTRLTELQQLLGAGLPEIVATLVRELTTAIDAVGAGLDEGDLSAAALAAHAARNSALMIDAQPLLARLHELESSARGDDLNGARAGYERLRDDWPALRTRLELAAADS
jgi:HPt (histidine-containing phosphotransfer) domain-containing protein